MRPDRDEILARYTFPLDGFQREAVEALDDSRHVIVAVPTGSGKTLVAEYAIATAMRDGRRAFYTAPIKALSNQKFRDLVEIHGEANVGLLTGDNSVNGDAPIVVMTTEVLRNMIYAGRDLTDLAVVVLDEVHFLQDAYRGPVWEEVIIHLPQHVRLVCLSATVSNSQELADWIETVRGPATAIVETRRPVQLDNVYVAADRTNDRLRVLPVIVDAQPNPDALRLDASAIRFRRDRRDQPWRSTSATLRLAPPGRLETVKVLKDRGLLPAIFFIFSRAQCAQAARDCVAAGLILTTEAERERIHEIAATRLDGLLESDLLVLGHHEFLAQLDAGVAPHHAGMIPPFKEVVEACFTEGLIKVVFATETLAVGINMPARSVVIEKLTKFTGEHHEVLTPGEYTQLTGRAGRRGIDELGTAVVLWSPFVRFEQVAELALSRTFQLKSAFRPTYNMAANLVRTYDARTARQLLSLSFAQFQRNREVVHIERRLQRQRARLAELDAEATSPFGNIDEYRSAAEGRKGPHFRDDPTELAMLALRPGTIIHASKGKLHAPVVVVATAHRKSGFRLTVISPAGHAVQLSGADFLAPPVKIGAVVLPGTYSPNRHDYRAEVARRLHHAKLISGQKRTKQAAPIPGTGMHPVENDPDLRARLAAADQADHVRNDISQLEGRVDTGDATLTREFDGVLAVLAGRGYMGIDEWKLTDAGETLARVFHEGDLLVTEVIRAGLLDGLDAPSFAGLVSTFVFENRAHGEPPAPWFPNHDVRSRWEKIVALSAELADLERRHGVSEHRAPDPTFFSVAHSWVSGQPFASVISDEDLTGGDFVRTVKQLVDVLGQIAKVAGSSETRAVATAAAQGAFRGVVADASVLDRQ